MKKLVLIATITVLLLFSGCPPTNDPPVTSYNYNVFVSTVPKVGSVSYTVTGNSSAAGVELLFLAQDAVEGYLFDHWEGNVGGTTNPVYLTAQGDLNIVAVYVKAYTLTLAVVPGTLTLSGITVTPAGVTQSASAKIYKESTTVNIAAVSKKEELVFRQWDGASTGTEFTTSLVMDSDKLLTALYVDSGTNALLKVGEIAREVLDNKNDVSPVVTNPESNITDYLYTINSPDSGYCLYNFRVVIDSGITFIHTWEFHDYQDGAGNIVKAGATPLKLVEEPDGHNGQLSGNVNLADRSGNNLEMLYTFTYYKEADQTILSALTGQLLNGGTSTITCNPYYSNRAYDYTFAPVP